MYQRLCARVQDKLLQKEHFQSHSIPLADFRSVPDRAEAASAGQDYGFPFMLKSRRRVHNRTRNQKRAQTYPVLRSPRSIFWCVRILAAAPAGLPRLAVPNSTTAKLLFSIVM